MRVGDTVHIHHPSGNLVGVVTAVNGRRVECTGLDSPDFDVLDLGTHYEVHTKGP